MTKLGALVCLLLVTVACAGTEPAADNSQPAGPAATITISEMSFGDPVTIGVGETLEIVNDDTLPHTWTSTDGLFDISLAVGESAEFTFDEAGEYAFVCTIHPAMAGSITVEG